MPTPQRDDYEPVDKPVRFYEYLLCLVALSLLIAAGWTQSRAAEIAAAASFALLIVVSLWNLLAPPRLSLTRCGFLFVGLWCGGVMGAILCFAP